MTESNVLTCNEEVFGSSPKAGLEKWLQIAGFL